MVVFVILTIASVDSLMIGMASHHKNDFQDRGIQVLLLFISRNYS